MGAQPTAPPRLLLVTANPDLQEVFAAIVAEEGYELRTASTLEEALALADTMAFALAMTDLHAGLSSYSFAPAHVLRRRLRPTPVALLTTESRLDRMDLARFIFVQKMPFDLERMLGGIAAALNTPLRAERHAQTEAVRRYFGALEVEDWPALLSLCTEDVAYYPPRASLASASRRIRGKDALREYLANAARYYQHMVFRDVRLYETPNGLAARYTGYWVTPDDTRQQAAHVTFLHFAGDLIAQVGVRVELEPVTVVNGTLGEIQAG